MTKMYKESERKTRNPYVGCLFNCKYCYPSFRRQAKRRGKQCTKCYNYVPHSHLERLGKTPPKTHGDEFIFLCDMGDISFASREIFYAVIGYCYRWQDRTFLIQSKAPKCFLPYRFPDNVILGTTVETYEDYFHVPWSDWGSYSRISQAPFPSSRLEMMKKLNHPRIMITVEPILNFLSENEFASRIAELKPWRVYVGYDSHPKVNHLPEPSLEKTQKLIEELRFRGIDIREKLIRKAWWE